MNIGKLKSSRSMLNKSATGSSKLMKSGDKLSASGKDTRLKRKSDQLEERSGNMKNRMVSYRFSAFSVISLCINLNKVN